MTELAATTAADALVSGHLQLVGHIVRGTLGRVPMHVDKDDLSSAGLTALVMASRAFEPDRGVSFAQYASFRVRGAVLDELRGTDWASRAVRRRSREISDTRSALAAGLGRAPSRSEVAADLDITVAQIDHNDQDVARASVLSLQGHDDNPLDEYVASSAPGPEEELEHREQLDYLAAAIGELPERLRMVIKEYFLAERPMAGIADTLGVTESRISQMRAEALVLLRHAMHSALDPTLVEPAARPEGPVARRRDAYVRAVFARHAS